jgi:hypothetical protein
MIRFRVMSVVASVMAASVVVACKSKTKSRGAVGVAGSPPATSPTMDPGTGLAAGASAASCTPAAPFQRPGTASVTVLGDGIDLAVTDAPAMCGALHTTASKRFAVGDGTLFRACLPDGSSFAISSDVALAGNVNPRFVYENYKKTGPLLEYSRPGIGTYNQRDEPTDNDKLFIAFDRSAATAAIVVAWPSKTARQVTVTASFVCDPPTP